MLLCRSKKKVFVRRSAQVLVHSTCTFIHSKVSADSRLYTGHCFRHFRYTTNPSIKNLCSHEGCILVSKNVHYHHSPCCYHQHYHEHHQRVSRNCLEILESTKIRMPFKEALQGRSSASVEQFSSWPINSHLHIKVLLYQRLL